MSNTPKILAVGSMVVAGVVAVAALLDIVMKFPFRGSTVMDICFILGAAIVIFMGWDSLQDMR